MKDSMVPSIIETEPDEDRVYRILDRRTSKFQRYYKEKLGIPDQHYDHQVKHPTLRKVLVNLDIINDDEPSIVGIKQEKSLTKKDETVSSEEGTRTILVRDLKPGEDPNALEKVTDVPSGQQGMTYEHDPSATGEFLGSVYTPEDEKFDVFSVMEKQDRQARRKKRLENMKLNNEHEEEEQTSKEDQRKIAIQDKISSKST